MKNKVRKILSDLNDGKIAVSKATEQVMDLFADVNKNGICPNNKCQDRFTGFCVNCSDRVESKKIK